MESHGWPGYSRGFWTFKWCAPSLGALFMTRFLADIITWVSFSQANSTNRLISHVIAKISLTPARICSSSRRAPRCLTCAPEQVCSDIPLGAIFFYYFPLSTAIKGWNLDMLVEPVVWSNRGRLSRRPLLEGSHSNVASVPLGSQIECHNC